VGPSVLGAVTSSDRTRPPGPGVNTDPVVCDPAVSDPGLEDHVREAVVPASIEDADLGTAKGPELTEVPETDDPLAESGQGLSPTPEGTSSSLPCGQQVVTPESSDSVSSSYEIISDTESERRPVRRMAPASGVLGTLGGSTETDYERPPLRFDDLFALARSAPV